MGSNNAAAKASRQQTVAPVYTPPPVIPEPITPAKKPTVSRGGFFGAGTSSSSGTIFDNSGARATFLGGY